MKIKIKKTIKRKSKSKIKTGAGQAGASTQLRS